MRFALLVAGAVALAVFSDLPVAAQYPGGGYPPGGYPPGSYPPGRYPGGGGGIPFPRRGKKKTSKDQQKQEQEQLHEVSGVLRKLEDKSMVVEAKDTRIINLKLSGETKYSKNGEPIKSSILKPGDHLRIDASQDEEGYFTAVRVELEKEGTAEERAEASVPVEASTQASEADDDRPVLRRKDSPADKDSAPERSSQRQDVPARGATPAPAPPRSTSASPEGASEAAGAQADPGVEIIQAPPGSQEQPIDESDPGPPKLKRGKPVAKKRTPAREVAANTPAPAKAGAPTATSTEPAPRSEPTATEVRPESPRPASEIETPVDPRIEKARAAVSAFTESLPSYICTEQMARFVSTSHIVNWQPVDIVSTEVVYENGRENYRNVAINGKPVKKDIEQLSGAWSTGEFGTVLVDLFSPSTAADFVFERDSKSGGRDAFRFRFDVEREHSHWRVQVPSQSVFPAYRGSIWVDKETARILRVEMQAYAIPEEFPLDKVESATDYEYVRLGERQFLLPVHAETLSCLRGTNNCSRNTIDFRNYHKYAGESIITFEKK
jgi:hypothetical protein